jgi:uncharacterized protein YecA (UPF0149 family)
MTFSTESEKILEGAVSGTSRVAKTIAEVPTEFREQALEAAERSYQQTVRDLGYTEAGAEGWISAVMFRLRSQVAEFGTKKLEVVGSEAEEIVEDPTSWGKVGRNEPCPCGSGKKFKHCHGRYV